MIIYISFAIIQIYNNKNTSPSTMAEEHVSSPESEMMMMMMSSEGDGKNILKMCFISSKSYSYNMYKKNHPIIIVSWSFREGCGVLCYVVLSQHYSQRENPLLVFTELKSLSLEEKLMMISCNSSLAHFLQILSCC